MAKEKKVYPNAQAPRLIAKIQSELKWTQNDLERVLRMTQQSVSNYRLARVKREQHEVIKTLENILAQKLPPPPKDAEEIITDEQADGSTASASDARRKRKPKTARPGSVSKGGSKSNRRQSAGQKSPKFT